MGYDTRTLPLAPLIGPMMSAGCALTRLDERLNGSPIRSGWIERTHFSDSAAALWLEGGLVHLEDLVLHDERMDVRTPTHELTRAHGILRARRRIFANSPDWALSDSGLRALTGPDVVPFDTGKAAQALPPEALPPKADEGNEIDPLAEEFAAIDAVLERTSQLLKSGIVPPRDPPQEPSLEPVPLSSRTPPSPLIYDQDWAEGERMAAWLGVLEETQALPVMLRAALLLDAWGQIEVLQHGNWLGGLLVASLLRREGMTMHHLACLQLGSRNIGRERRRSPDRIRRVIALLGSIEAAAELGLKEHDRLVLAKNQMERRLKNRRSNSKLPELITLVLSRPLVSAGMIQKGLNVTQQGALNLIDELALREITGRKRFRAWGVI